MKTKTTYICSECGYKSPKWLGKCPGCNSWNTIQETVITEKKTSATRAMSISNGGSVRMPKKIGDVKVGYETRYKTGLQELDRVLGGGIVQGELILVGGDPGIGKSTLLLQICQKPVKKEKFYMFRVRNRRDKLKFVLKDWALQRKIYILFPKQMLKRL